jgi:hypothetical protein
VRLLHTIQCVRRDIFQRDIDRVELWDWLRRALKGCAAGVQDLIFQGHWPISFRGIFIESIEKDPKHAFELLAEKSSREKGRTWIAGEEDACGLLVHALESGADRDVWVKVVSKLAGEWLGGRILEFGETLRAAWSWAVGELESALSGEAAPLVVDEAPISGASRPMEEERLRYLAKGLRAACESRTAAEVIAVIAPELTALVRRLLGAVTMRCLKPIELLRRDLIAYDMGDGQPEEEDEDLLRLVVEAPS